MQPSFSHKLKEKTGVPLQMTTWLRFVAYSFYKNKNPSASIQKKKKASSVTLGLVHTYPT